MPDKSLEESLKKIRDTSLISVKALIHKTVLNEIEDATEERIRAILTDIEKEFKQITDLMQPLGTLQEVHLRLYDVYEEEVVIDTKYDENRKVVHELMDVRSKTDNPTPSLSDFYALHKGTVRRAIPCSSPLSLVILTAPKDTSVPDLINPPEHYFKLGLNSEIVDSIKNNIWTKSENIPDIMRFFVGELHRFLFEELEYPCPSSKEEQRETLFQFYSIIKRRTDQKLNKPLIARYYYDYLIPAVFGEETIFLLATYAMTSEGDPSFLTEVTNYLGTMSATVSSSFTKKKFRNLEKETFGETYEELFGKVLWNSILDFLKEDAIGDNSSFATNIAVYLENLRKILYRSTREKNLPAVIFDEFQTKLLEFLSGKKLASDCEKDCDSCLKEKRDNCLGGYLPYRMLHNALDFHDTLKNMPRYRDHYIHSFHVFLLGYYLIQKLGFQYFNSIRLPLNNKDEILEAWFWASMYHDVSYPIAKVEEWLGGFYKKVVLKPKEKVNDKSHNKDKFHREPILLNQELFRLFLHEQYQRALNQLYKGLNDIHEIPSRQLAEMENRIMRELIDEKDHGVLSAVLFLNSLGFEERESSTFRLATDAILWHNELWNSSTGNDDLDTIRTMRDLLKEAMVFANNPLCNLLAFCDTAQEWGRYEPDQNFNVKLRFLKYDPDNMELTIGLSRDIKENKKSQAEEINALHYNPQKGEWKKHEITMKKKSKVFSFDSAGIKPSIVFGQWHGEELIRLPGRTSLSASTFSFYNKSN